jgi:Family of unknown function (DUF6507)
VDWDIDVPGVNKVLTDTVAEAKPFDGLAKSYGEKLKAIMGGLDYDAFKVVAVAVGDYATHWSPTLEAAAKQVGASLTGAQNAVKAYMGGQEEMAMNAQHAAANGEIPDPPGGKKSSGKNKAV